MSNTPRFTSLQAFRAIGAVLIFIHHSGLQGPLVMSFGDAAVCWFFMLSGFVMSVRCDALAMPDTQFAEWCRPRAIASFMVSRLRKIAPVYYATLLVMLALAAFAVPWPSILFPVLMLQSWVPSRDVFFALNGPEWFISSILFCYLLFRPSMWVVRRLGSRLPAVCAGLFIIYLVVVATLPDDWALFGVYIFPPMELPAFLLGLLVSRLVPRFSQFRRYPSASIAAAFLLMAAAMFAYRFIPTRFGLSLYWWLPTMLMLTILASTDSVRCAATRILHFRPLVALGDASMIFYLCHIPWIYVTRILFGKASLSPSPAIVIPVSILLLAILSISLNRLLRRR